MVLWFVASHRFLPEFDELSPTNIFHVLFPTTSSSSSSCSCPVIPMSPCKLCSIIIYQISGLWNFPFPIPARIFCVRNNENGAKNDDPPKPLINKWIRKWDSIEPKTVTGCGWSLLQHVRIFEWKRGHNWIRSGGGNLGDKCSIPSNVEDGRLSLTRTEEDRPTDRHVDVVEQLLRYIPNMDQRWLMSCICQIWIVRLCREWVLRFMTNKLPMTGNKANEWVDVCVW